MHGSTGQPGEVRAEGEAPQHTGLPWHVAQSVIGRPGLYFVREAAEADPLEHDANSQFIEDSVNSHYELLAACRKGIESAGCVYGEVGDGWEYCDCWMCENTRYIQGVIAKAEGGSCAH